MGGSAAETATERLARLLTMVPWLVNRQGIDLQQAADDLGVSVEQLEADLNLLFLCGYGQMPDELIEADWEEGRVFVGNADTIARPLRLGVDEAVTLMVGLRALREVPGLGERDAVDRALAKLEDAGGSGGRTGQPGRARDADGSPAELLARARRAIADLGGSTCATSCPPVTSRPSATSTPCGSSGSTGGGTSRAGATAPRTPGCSGWTGSRSSPSSTSTAPRRPRPGSGTCRRASSGPGPTTSSSPSAAAGGHVGRRLLPRRVGGAGAAADGGWLVVRVRTADTAWLRRLMWRLGGRGVGPRPAGGGRRGARGRSAALTAYPATVGGG